MASDANINIQVLDTAHRKSEPPTYHLVRDRGQDAINFIHFTTPIIFYIEGTEIEMARNACIIYTPGVHQEYKSLPEGFTNNFVTFKTDTSAFLERYKLPLNTPFYIQGDKEVTSQVEHIAWAAANRLEPLMEDIANNVLALFAMLEKIQIGQDPKSQREAQTKQSFIVLRGAARVNPKGWTVDKMAESAFLSRSRFDVLYKRYFGVSPNDDLINAMLDYAKDRLLSTNDTIAVISADCGYKHTESFIRIFYEREGFTPGQYRKAEKMKF